jgi:hypothetical protein
MQQAGMLRGANEFQNIDRRIGISGERITQGRD